MRVRNHGKYTNMRKNAPRAIARCDTSGFMVEHASLQKQYQYAGTGLVFTGYYVHPKFLDKPNPQNLTPRIKLDPVPTRNARPDNIIDAQYTLATSVGVLTIDVSPSVNVTLTRDQFVNNGSFNFIGTLTADIIVYVPNIFQQFYANKLTTGNFTLSMQLLSNMPDPIEIPAANPVTQLGPIITSTATNLIFTNN